MPRMKKVAVLGKGPLAVLVAEWFLRSQEHDLAAIVPVLPEPEWTVAFSEQMGERYDSHHEVLEHHDLLFDGVFDGGWDIVFSCFYDKLLSAEHLDEIELPLNMHPGPLPRYRGVRPLNWALKNGEDHHGVTIHKMHPGIDNGPIYSQVIFPLFPDDGLRTAYDRMLRYAWELFRDTMPKLDIIVPRVQDGSQALTYRHSDDARLGEWASW